MATWSVGLVTTLYREPVTRGWSGLPLNRGSEMGREVVARHVKTVNLQPRTKTVGACEASRQTALEPWPTGVTTEHLSLYREQ